ncbi:MAG: hypothetical protein GWO84_02990 [Euryarchaeota archaeon]|nr:hypothetical protein [Euryarchaeota archaeon]
MDDEEKYGTIFHSLTFGKAIKQKIIADYQIILASCNYNDSDVDALYNAAEISGISEKEWPLTVLEAYQALFISKLLLEDKISKTLTFQNSVARAQAFAFLLQQIVPSEISCDSIWGAEGIANRREKKSQFSLAEKAVLSNVRCLSEGVDLPMIDSVVFCDDRSSPIDLIQAVGRALRKKPGEDKIASILIPMPIPSEVETLDDIDWDNVPGMTTFHYVLQALRDQDEILNHEIDDIIFQGQRGKLPPRPKSGGKIDHVMILPEKMKIDIHDMWGKIAFRISDANFRKEGEKSIFGELGKIKGDRKSKHKTMFPNFGDYNVQKGMKDECLEVIAQLSDDKKPISRSTLGEYASSNGNNTASMLVSIGAVEETEGNKVMITSIGLGLKAHPEQWNNVVINQALIFSKNQIEPYRLILNVLLKYGQLNYHEYLLGISQIEVIGRKLNHKQIKKTISYLRNKYPHGLSRIPDNKHDDVITELERNRIEVNVEKKDIWSAKTTQKNKWGYLKSCLELFPCIIIDKDWIRVKDGQEDELKLLLINSKPAVAKTYGTSSSIWYTPVLKADDANDDDDDDDFDLL